MMCGPKPEGSALAMGLFISRIPGIAAGLKMWSPLQQRMLSSKSSPAKWPTVLCHETRNPGLKLT